jgi:hypothetical protein
MQQPMGGFGGGYGQQQMQQPMGGFGQMGGGYGQMGGFGQQMPQRQMGGYGQQMGFNQQRQMQQPMGGFGGGFGGGYNPMGDMGQMNRGFNQQQMGGFGGQMDGGFGGQMGGGFNQQGGQGGMGNNMQPNQNPAAQTNSAPMSFEDFKKQSLSFQDTGPERDRRDKSNYEHYLNKQPTQQQLQTGGGMQGQNAMPMDRNMMSQIVRAQQGGMQGGMGGGFNQQGGMGLAGGAGSMPQNNIFSQQPQDRAAMDRSFQAMQDQSAGRMGVGSQSVMPNQAAQPQVTTSDAQAIPEYARPYAQNMMGGAFGALSQPGMQTQGGMQGPQGLDFLRSLNMRGYR